MPSAACPPAATWATDQLDDDGIVDEPVPVQVNVEIEDDHMTVDFAGSSPQTLGNVELSLGLQQGRRLLHHDRHRGPLHGGERRDFQTHRVESEEGLITRPLPPAGVTARSQTMTKLTEAMLKP